MEISSASSGERRKDVKGKKGDIRIKQIWVQIPVVPLKGTVCPKGLTQMNLNLLIHKLKILELIFGYSGI